jgi:hypothetical protein
MAIRGSLAVLTALLACCSIVVASPVQDSPSGMCRILPVFSRSRIFEIATTFVTGPDRRQHSCHWRDEINIAVILSGIKTTICCGMLWMQIHCLHPVMHTIKK